MSKYKEVLYTDTMKEFVDKYNENLRVLEQTMTVVPKLRENFVLAEKGQISITKGYNRGVNDMQVFCNGILLENTEDYIETSDNMVTILKEVTDRDKITLIYTPKEYSVANPNNQSYSFVVDSTTSTSKDEALSANKGKEINDRLTENIGALTQEILSLQDKDIQIQGSLDVLQQTFNDLIINAGDSNSEIVQARTSSVTGNHSILKDRLDTSDVAIQQLVDTTMRLGDDYIGSAYPLVPELLSEFRALKEEVTKLQEESVMSFPQEFGIAQIPEEEIHANLARLNEMYRQTVFPRTFDPLTPMSQYKVIALVDVDEVKVLVPTSTELVMDTSGETQFSLNQYYNSRINQIINSIESILVRLNKLDGGN